MSKFTSIALIAIFGLGFMSFQTDLQHADDESKTHKCFDTFVTGGSTYISVNCSGCKSQRNEQHLDSNTCSHS